MPFKLLVIGLGNMGRRHLQAAVRVPGLEAVIGYDIDAGADAFLRTFIAENQLNVPNLTVEREWPRCLSRIDGNTVVIIATTAKGRAGLLKDIMAKRPLAIVAEKPLCQTSAELALLTQLAKQTGVPLYVNFSRRVYPCYQQILRETLRTEPWHMSVEGSQGLACNGIHALDLAVWLSGVGSFAITDSALDEVFELKRRGFQDFAGRMSVRFSDKGTAVFSAVKGPAVFSVNVVTASADYHIYEESGKMVTARKGKAPVETGIVVPFTSQFMDGVLQDIVSLKKPALPDIAEASLAHEMLFAFMSRHGISALNIT